MKNALDPILRLLLTPHMPIVSLITHTKLKLLSPRDKPGPRMLTTRRQICNKDTEFTESPLDVQLQEIATDRPYNFAVTDCKTLGIRC